MAKVTGYAAMSETSALVPFHFETRSPRVHDVVIEILFCGICHTDLHIAHNEWKGTVYPVIPGHEIVGRVIQLGSAVKSFKPGDIVGVGCIIDCCRGCSSCQAHLEQYCEKGYTLVFNTRDAETQAINYGGYAQQIVVDEKFVLHIPKKFQERDLPAVAPLLCAGITTYSPLKHWGVGKGTKVGVVGLGGLGHMAVKLAHAMGAHVIVFTTSLKKVNEAKKLGADEVVFSRDEEAMRQYKNSLDFILSTVSFSYDLNGYLDLLQRDGTLCLVGLPSQPHPPLGADSLVRKRRQLAGSLIGGIQETQEMLDFCAKHNVLANVEVIRMDEVNAAYERMLKNDVKYRFVIDIASIKV